MEQDTKTKRLLGEIEVRLREAEETLCVLQRTEEILKKLERGKATILDAMSEIITRLTADMKIIWANRAASESVDLAPEQLKNRIHICPS